VRTEAEGGEAEGEVEGGGDEDREAEGHLLTLGGGAIGPGTEDMERRTPNTYQQGGDGSWGSGFFTHPPSGGGSTFNRSLVGISDESIDS